MIISSRITSYNHNFDRSDIRLGSHIFSMEQNAKTDIISRIEKLF